MVASPRALFATVLVALLTLVATPYAHADPGTVVLQDGSRAEGDLAVSPGERVVVRYEDGGVRIVAWSDVRLVFVDGRVIDSSGVATEVPRGPTRVRTIDRGDRAASDYARSLPRPVVIRTELAVGGVVLAGGLSLITLGGIVSARTVDSDRPKAFFLAGVFGSIGGAALIGLGIHDRRHRQRGLDALGRHGAELRMGFDLALAPGHVVPSWTLRF